MDESAETRLLIQAKALEKEFNEDEKEYRHKREEGIKAFLSAVQSAKVGDKIYIKEVKNLADRYL